MSRVELTEAQAKKLGIEVPKTKKSRKGMGRDGARSRCVKCGEEFTSDAAETRHLIETMHARYEGVLEA